MTNLSPHISGPEYRCPCCNKLPPDLYKDGELAYCYAELFDLFEWAREEWGEPIPITSGYRCSKHNAEVGGEPASVHLYGLALDLTIHPTRKQAFVQMLRDSGRPVRIGWKKYGPESSLVHADLGFYVWPRPSEFLIPGVEW